MSKYISEDCTCSHPGGHERCPQHGIDAPAEPVTDEECPHCGGTGEVDDDWEVNGQHVGATFPCDRCDRGVAPVDAHGVCACEDCLHLPRDQRQVSRIDTDASRWVEP